MENEPGPGARRRYLGKTLRKLREQRGMTTAGVAKQMHASQPTVSRIEGGRGTIMARHVYRMLEIFGVEEAQADTLMRIAEQANERGWWESYTDTIPDWFEIYASLESDSAEQWMYEAEFVPGLFQTEDYIRALRLASHPDSTPDQVARSAQLRLERQQQIRDQQISAVINEAVVRRQVGNATVMRDQLARLVAEIDRGVDLRVLPFASGAHAAMTGSFIMLRFPDRDEMDLVYVENERGGMYLEREADLLRHGDVFTRVRDQALSVKETRSMLASLVSG